MPRAKDLHICTSTQTSWSDDVVNDKLINSSDDKKRLLQQAATPHNYRQHAWGTKEAEWTLLYLDIHLAQQRQALEAPLRCCFVENPWASDHARTRPGHRRRRFGFQAVHDLRESQLPIGWSHVSISGRRFASPTSIWQLTIEKLVFCGGLSYYCCVIHYI